MSQAEKIEGAPLIAPSTTDHPLYDQVVEACRTVFDPEIPVNIYDLGLVYTVDISAENEVEITMTLTAPGCPVAGEMPGWVANAVEPLPGVMGRGTRFPTGHWRNYREAFAEEFARLAPVAARLGYPAE